MKIKSSEIRKIVIQEIRRLREMNVSSEVYDADVDDLIRFGDAYASLGDDIQSQLKEALQHDDPEMMSPGALGYIEDRLSGFNDYLDDLISRGRESQGPRY